MARSPPVHGTAAELRERAAHCRDLAAEMRPGPDAETLQYFARDYLEAAENLEDRADLAVSEPANG